MSPRRSPELLHGTLESLILRVLADGRDHGFGIGKRIAEELAPTTPIEDGSLYPALYRLERRRWIRGVWSTSDAGRRARFYEITPSGARALRKRVREWTAFAGAVSRLLEGR